MPRLALLAGLLLLVPGLARADAYDFRLYKLGSPTLDPSANARFSAFANELGMAIVNWNLEPPETTGFSGFDFALEYPVSLINDKGLINGKRYWALETDDAAGNLQLPGVHVRKGLPFSFEAGAKVNYISRSSMAVATVEAKWALNEGFLYFPDLGVRGFGTQLLGSRDFTLTVAGFDIGLGKQLPINGMFTLTPYAGWSSVWVAASSNVIDFKPQQSERDQFTASNSASGTATTDVFESVEISKNRHNRYYGGIRFISYVVEIGLEASYGFVTTEHHDYMVATYSAKLGLDF